MNKPNHHSILCHNYMTFPLVLNPLTTSFEAVYCFICGRRTVAVARYRMICLVLALSHVLIDSQKLFYFKSGVAEWFERDAGKRRVAGSIPGGGIYFHFEFFAYFPLLSARRIPYK